MSAATDIVTSTKSRPRGERWPLTRIVSRQMWPVAALLLLVALRIGGYLVFHYFGWSHAVDLRARIGKQEYDFGRHPGDAHVRTAQLLQDGARLAFQPALYAAALTGVVTGREWQSRRVALTLAQSVSARRWFAARWAGLAAVVLVLVLPLVVLYRHSTVHAVHLDLLTHGIDRHTAYFTIGPVTVAYVLLGVAAGALTGTVLRRTVPALIAAPALTWLLTALLVRSRVALLIDFPAWSRVSGWHAGGVLGLQFYDVLPQDTFLVDSLKPGDYWPYQIAQSAVVLAVAAVLTWAALRVLRRRTAGS